MTITPPALGFLWLEITGRCQLECLHCYAESGPTGRHGSMSHGDWIRAIDQATDAGVSMVQFIGGEPTLHPSLPGLITHALAHGVEVEVYSSLVHILEAMWTVFSRSVPGWPPATTATTRPSAKPSWRAPDARVAIPPGVMSDTPFGSTPTPTS